MKMDDNEDESTVGEEDLGELEDSDDEGFMEGYSRDQEVEECAECGAALKEGKKVVREIEGEEHHFCSKECADEFEEGMTKIE